MESATMATIGAAVDVGLKLPELGQRLMALVDDVKGPRVEVMVLDAIR